MKQKNPSGQNQKENGNESFSSGETGKGELIEDATHKNFLSVRREYNEDAGLAENIKYLEEAAKHLSTNKNESSVRKSPSKKDKSHD